MIDEGELDWKIVAISLDDPRASLVNDADDVEKHFPVSGLLFDIVICKIHNLANCCCPICYQNDQKEKVLYNGK